jgi:parallel beta-helix repeat protein
MKTRLLRVSCCVMAAAFTGTVQWANAGDLNPPVGAIAPTGRTPLLLSTTPGDADSLFKITQPGSYYLRNNVTGVVGKIGIEIAVATGGVTVDLGGFELAGVAGTLEGILVTVADTPNVIVKNGAVRGWGASGVSARNADGVIFLNLNSSGNAVDGIVAGKGSTVTGCTSVNNGADGFDVDEGSSVSNCIARGNGGHGIQANVASVITHCTSSENTVDGIRINNKLNVGLMIVSAGGTVTECTVNGNGDDGIQGDENTTVAGCSASYNGDDGIQLGSGSMATDCSTSDNGDDGIQAGRGSTITNNSVRKSTGDGIVVTIGCLVRGNNCRGNLQAGIHVAVSGAGEGDNHIESNNVSDNLFGIKIDAAGNFIVRNSASGNGLVPSVTNYSIIGIQTIGPIVTLTGTIASTSPWANFSY